MVFLLRRKSSTRNINLKMDLNAKTQLMNLLLSLLNLPRRTQYKKSLPLKSQLKKSQLMKNQPSKNPSMKSPSLKSQLSRTQSLKIKKMLIRMMTSNFSMKKNHTMITITIQLMILTMKKNHIMTILPNLLTSITMRTTIITKSQFILQKNSNKLMRHWYLMKKKKLLGMNIMYVLIHAIMTMAGTMNVINYA